MTDATVQMSVATDAPILGWSPVRQADATLTEQLAAHLAARIRNHGWRAGSRLPSVRTMAERAGVSRFTVVQAYDRLVAQGLVQSRRGAGFYVRALSELAAQSASLTQANGHAATHTARQSDADTQRGEASSRANRSSISAPCNAFDTAFLLRSLFRDDLPADAHTGAGLLPAHWLDRDLIQGAVRAVGRSAGRSLLSYGVPQGLRALRQHIAAGLQAQDVPAHPDQHLMTVAGVTHGLDLVVSAFVRPGDTVLVEDPAWFLIFGRLSAIGAHVVGVPRLADGPDVDALARLAALHQPKLFICNTAVHNPTGHTLSAGVAHEVLRIAERHDMVVVEDDTYADFHPGVPLRLTALDRFKRVILVGGYSKTLAASLRVGYLAAPQPLLERLIDLKLLSGLTTPELGEQVVGRILSDGLYRRHVDRLRARVDASREATVKALLALGCRCPQAPAAGMFVWVDCGRDTEVLARVAAEQGVLLAPGMLFSPDQAPSRMLRVSVGALESEQGWTAFKRLLRSGPREP